MEQRDELEIETRLRAALAARSELVTHSTLRPGVPPNEHTAGVRSGGGGFWTSWRRFLVPVTVAAALAGGVFVGAQLPHDKAKSDVSAGSGPGGASTDASTFGAATGDTSSAPASGTPTNTQAAEPSSAAAGKAAEEASVDTLRFTVADGWQLTQLDDTSACVTPKAKETGGTGGEAAAKPALPCGVDALYLKSDAAVNAWPVSTAAKDSGWWPKTVAQVSDIACPAAKPGSGDQVQSSELLRSSAKYALSAQLTAEYHEWAVTCDTGSGARPMLWRLKPAGGSSEAKSAVAAVVSVDPAYDSALLGMVGTLHLAG